MKKVTQSEIKSYLTEDPERFPEEKFLWYEGIIDSLKNSIYADNDGFYVPIWDTERETAYKAELMEYILEGECWEELTEKEEAEIEENGFSFVSN